MWCMWRRLKILLFRHGSVPLFIICKCCVLMKHDKGHGVRSEDSCNCDKTFCGATCDERIDLCGELFSSFS